MIWNYVCKDGDNYVPFEGTIDYKNTSGGLTLAPKADVLVNSVADASCFAVNTITNNGVELHQQLFGGDDKVVKTAVYMWPTGSLVFNKEAKEKPDRGIPGVKVKGAEFEAYILNGTEKVVKGTGISDENGEVLIKGLRASDAGGTALQYYIRETKPADGYVPDGTAYGPYSVTENKQTPIMFTSSNSSVLYNEREFGDIKIIKTIAGEPKPEEKDYLFSFMVKITPSDPSLLINGMVFKNAAGTAEYHSVVSGDSFVLKDVSGNDPMIKAGESLSITGLPTGKYSIAETGVWKKKPDNSLEKKDLSDFQSALRNNEGEISNNQCAEITVKNTKKDHKGRIKLTKKYKHTGEQDSKAQTLSGVVFTILDSTDFVVGELHEDPNSPGTYISDDLACAEKEGEGPNARFYSTYKIRESVPAGFAGNGELGEIKVYASDPVDYTEFKNSTPVVNTMKSGTLQLEKNIIGGDSATQFTYEITIYPECDVNLAVGTYSGIEFTEVTGENAITATVKRSQNDGLLTIEHLPVGKVIITETDGTGYKVSYSINNQTKDGNIAETAIPEYDQYNPQNVANVKFINTKPAKMTLKKQVKIGEEQYQPLAGVTFQIYAGDSQYNCTLLEGYDMVTNEHGFAESKEIYVNSSGEGDFIVKEITPTGLTGEIDNNYNEKVYSIKLKAGETTELNNGNPITNEAVYSGIEIKKAASNLIPQDTVFDFQIEFKPLLDYFYRNNSLEATVLNSTDKVILNRNATEDAFVGNIQLKAGQSLTLLHLPFGTFNIVESNNGHYLTSWQVDHYTDSNQFDSLNGSGSSAFGTLDWYNKYNKNDIGSRITFTNTIETEAIIQVKKNIIGDTPDEDGVFSFTLSAEDGVPMPEGTNGTEVTVSGVGSGKFGKIVYTAEGTYTYTITEDNSDLLPGYSYDTDNPKTVYVEVKKIGNTYSPLIVYPDNKKSAEFTNQYSKLGYVSVKKTDSKNNNMALSGAVFKIYKDASGTLGDEVTTLITGTEGTAMTGALPTGHYWIKETKAPAGYIIDDAAGQEISITAGHTTSSPLELSFTDTMVSAVTQVYAKKSVVGNVPADMTFTFELTSDTVVPMPGADGNIIVVKGGESKAFGDITFTYADLGGDESTVITYIVKEIIPDPKAKGITYDEASHMVKVVLAYDSTTHDLTATVTDPETGKTDGTIGNPVLLVNTYKAEKTKLSLKVAKTIDGSIVPTTDATFTFELSTTTNAPMPEATGKIVAVQGADSAEFGEITYEEPGKYQYTVTEDQTVIPGYRMDTHTYEVTVNVTDNGGELTAHVISPVDMTCFTFTNTYTGGGIELSKVDEANGKPLAGAVFSVYSDDKCTMLVKEMPATDETGSSKLENLAAGKYWVKETNAPDGYELSGTVYEVTVVDGQIAKVTTDPIRNTMVSAVTRVYAKKSIVGNVPADMTFTFELTSDTVVPMPGADGNIIVVKGGESKAFGDITFTYADLGGEESTVITYIVKEIIPVPKADGMTYDEASHMVKVALAYDSKTNALTATITDPETKKTDWGTENNPVILVNTYDANSTKLKLEVGKELSIRGAVPATSSTFSFELSTTTDAPMPQASGNITSVTGKGTAEFGEIVYSKAGTYTYTITEMVPDPIIPGYTYDTRTYEVTVTVKDIGGELSATVNYPDGEAPFTFTNTYEAGYLQVRKADAADTTTLLEGAVFTVYSDENCEKTVTTLTTGQEGTAISEALPAGNYWVKETKAPEGYTNDGTEKTKVTVPACKIADAVTYTFTDTMVSAVTRVYAKKSVVGNVPADMTFTFELTSDTVVPMPGADGNIIVVKGGESKAFGDITFTYADLGGEESTVITYIVKEIIPVPKADGMTYDEASHMVKVALAYDSKTNALTATVTDPETKKTDWGTENSPVILVNTYDANSTKLKLEVGKELSIPGAVPATSSTFSFELSTTTDAPMPQASGNITSVTGKGTAEFGEIVYSKEGTYTYTITEMVPDPVIPGYTYDTRTYEVTVEVTDIGGELSATVNYPDGEAPFTFTNTYEAGYLQVKKADSANTTTLLEGAVFTVYSDEKCEKTVTTLTTGQEGTAISEALPAGNYWVKETKAPEGYTNDGTKATEVTVPACKVADAVTYTFTDTMVSAVTRVYAKKSVVGNVPADMTFTFELTSDTVVPMPGADGNIIVVKGGESKAFGDITFTYADLGGEESTVITYIVKEIIPVPKADGMTYDEASHMVKVALAYDSKTNALTATITDPETKKTDWGTESNPVILVNTYDANSTKLKLEVGKELSIPGAVPATSSTFSFELSTTTDAPMPQASGNITSVTGKGTAEFGEIVYSKEGTYTYTITEMVPDPVIPGYTYDTRTYEVTVEVEDIGGELSATVNYPDGKAPFTFTNTYEAGYLQVRKADSANTTTLLEGAVFTVYSDENCEKTVTTLTTGQEGTAISEALPAGNYWVKETKAPEGYTNDGTEATKVTVAACKVADAVTYTFTDTELSTSAVLTVKKTLKDLSKADAEFGFELTRNSANPNAPLPAATTIQVKAGKTGIFGEFRFKYTDLGGETSKTFKYDIHEIIPADKIPGVTYDTETHTLDIILKWEDGVLTATPSTATKELEIINTYGANGSVTFGGVKSIDFRDLKPGDEFSFSVKEVTPGATAEYTGKTVKVTEDRKTTAISFDPIVYSLKDTGTHTYVISENVSGVKDVVAANGTEYTVIVYVADKGDGTLNVTKANGSDDWLNLNFVNSLCQTIVEVTKTWDGGEETDIQGALKLYTLDGGELSVEIPDPGFTKATAKTGVYQSKLVPRYKPGTGEEISYAVVEVRPDGYTVIYDGGGKNFATAGGTIVNSAYPKLEMRKADGGEKSKGLEGAVYTLYTEPTCTPGNEKTEIGPTDANGLASAGSLEYGVYYLKETVAPENYAVSDDTYAVVYAAHSDKSEVIGVYLDADCTNKVGSFQTDNDGPDGSSRGTGSTVIEVGTASATTVYVARESDVAAGKKTSYEISMPQSVLKENNGKLYIHFNRANVYDYKLIDVSFGLEKSVVGNDPAAATFEFSLTAENGVPCSEKSTVTISYPTKTQDYFGKIVYGKPGVYEYKVKETVGNAPGYTYDGKEHTLVVTVEDDGGVLVPKATYDGKALELKKGTSLNGCDLYSNLTGIEFVNNFSLIAKTQMKASKTLTGRELSGGEFSFTLKSKAGTGTPGYEETVTNGKEGSVTFSEIVYDGATHKGKTYTYELAEVQTNMPGYTLDDTVYEVVVKLSDDMQSVTQTFYELSGSTRIAVDSIKFVNAYEATASVTFEGAKAMTGRELTKGDEFSFTVTEDGNPVATGHSDETGVITFTTINYYLNNEKSDIGEHTYIVTEDDTNRLGVTKDGRELTVKVTVTDNGDGTLKTELSYGAELSRVKFVNAYEASGCVTFTGAKELKGRELTDSDEFSFTVKEGTTTVATGKSDKNGVIKFTEIRYYLNNEKSDIGEHTYIVAEDDTTIPLITKDGRELTVKVMVVDEGNGKLRADILSGGNELTFINQYDASGKITLTGSKALTGRELTTGDEFSFTVKEGSTVVATGKNDLTGKITFNEIVYHLEDAGTHVYTVTEDAFTKPGVTGDNAELTVTVFVTNNKASGTMEAEIVKTESDELAFQNAYEASGCITFTGAKILTGRELTKGDEFTFTVTENGKTVAYGTNNETSVITFTEIRYVLNAEKSDIGEHTYIVTEDDTTIPGITKDGRELTVKVKVTDEGNGKLKTEILSGGDELTFTNAYEATGTVEIKAFKYIDAIGVLPGADEKFDFYLEKEDGSRITVQNGEKGVVDFGLLEYTEKDIGETFVYTLREKQAVNGAFVTDPTVYIMTVNVEDNGDGTLNPIVTLERIAEDGTATEMKDDEEITFVNGRKTSVSITKEWEGGEEDEIVLILYANGEKVPETETVKDPETGKPVDKINYVLDREGYRYTFSQLAPRDADGKQIVYGVKEKGISGYMRIYQNVGEFKNKKDYVYDGGTVINRAVTSIRVKKVWEGIDDESKRPAITLTLYCNDSVYSKQPSGPDKDGWYSWSNLPTVYGGRDAVYYVKEEPMAGFETSYSNKGMYSDVTDRAYNGGTITNSGVPATGDSTPVVFLGGLLGMSILGVVLILRKKKSGRRA